MEFKTGDLIRKARWFNKEKYCRYGGTPNDVPIGTTGKITKLHTYTANVTFDNGKRWTVALSEIDKANSNISHLINEL